MKDFFMSYNSADKDRAEWIAWQLKDAGYTNVIQAWDFGPGQNFVLAMQKAATEARRTIAVLSPDYLAAKFTVPEWAAAFVQDPTGEHLLIPKQYSNLVKQLKTRLRVLNRPGLNQIHLLREKNGKTALSLKPT